MLHTRMHTTGFAGRIDRSGLGPLAWDEKSIENFKKKKIECVGECVDVFAAAH